MYKGAEEMDKETREFLENMQNGMNDRFDRIEVRLDNFEGRMDNLETGQNRLEGRMDNLEAGQEEIKSILGELEPRNAERHLQLQSSIDELRKDVSTMEIVTSSNYLDIAKIKSII